MDSKTHQDFKKIVWDYYDQHQRLLPWRIPSAGGVFDPYHILVSEIMLQQTQVDRVLPKYTMFLDAFPDISLLANAPFEDVLRVWSGLGYNRRAKYLHDFAKENRKQFPETVEELTRYKGIGSNTAAAVLVYTHNEVLIFIETNIRTVFLHHFFKDTTNVSDKQILQLVEETVDRDNPREWYWALMDYGSYLKKSGIKNLSQSKQHRKQSKFEGSDRQIRGEILRLLLKNGNMSRQQIEEIISDGRSSEILRKLEKDNLIQILQDTVRLM